MRMKFFFHLVTNIFARFQGRANLNETKSSKKKFKVKFGTHSWEETEIINTNRTRTNGEDRWGNWFGISTITNHSETWRWKINTDSGVLINLFIHSFQVFFHHNLILNRRVGWTSHISGKWLVELVIFLKSDRLALEFGPITYSVNDLHVASSPPTEVWKFDTYMYE